MNLEINEVAPICHPLVQQSSVISFHYLIAPRQLVIYSTRHIIEALGSHMTALAKPTINGYGILAFEVLHDHVQSHHVSLTTAANAQ